MTSEHTFSSLVSGAVKKKHEQKQLGRGMGLFGLKVIGRHGRKSREELKAGT